MAYSIYGYNSLEANSKKTIRKKRKEIENKVKLR